MDLGSRSRLADENELVWYPAEVNTSIRPGWFYHSNEDGKVRSLNELIEIYNGSVGGNATFLLNIPPMPTGLFHMNDVKRLKELGEYLGKAFSDNILENAEITAESEKPGCNIGNVLHDGYNNYFMPESKDKTAIYINWENETDIGSIVIKENIAMSQRVESFTVEAKQNGGYEAVYSGTVIGHKRIIPCKSLHTNGLRICITDSREEPAISFIGVYKAME